MAQGIYLNANLFFDHAKSAWQRIMSADRDGGQMEALTAIVFAAFSLEAFINELSDRASLLETVEGVDRTIIAFAGLMDDLEESRASITAKFFMGKLVLTGTTYEKGAQPYQDFATLIALRNTLVHLRKLDKFEVLGTKPGFEIKSADAPPIVRTLESKNILAASPSWFARLTTKAVARWSSNAAAEIVQSLLDGFPNDKYSQLLVDPYKKFFVL